MTKNTLSTLYAALNSGEWSSAPYDRLNVSRLNHRRFSMLLIKSTVKSKETLKNDIHRLALVKLGNRATEGVRYELKDFNLFEF